MARRTREEILERIRGFIGDRSDDEVLGFLEDFDESWPESDGEDWKSRYDELDRTWRERYRERFFAGPVTEEIRTEITDGEEEVQEEKRIDDLFGRVE